MNWYLRYIRAELNDGKEEWVQVDAQRTQALMEEMTSMSLGKPQGLLPPESELLP